MGHCTGERVPNYRHAGPKCSSCLQAAAAATAAAATAAAATAATPVAAAFASAAAAYHSTPALCITTTPTAMTILANAASNAASNDAPPANTASQWHAFVPTSGTSTSVAARLATTADASLPLATATEMTAARNKRAHDGAPVASAAAPAEGSELTLGGGGDVFSTSPTATPVVSAADVAADTAALPSAAAAADPGKNVAAAVYHSTQALCTLASAPAATAPIGLASPATCAATAPTTTPVAAAAHTAAASLLNPGGGGGGREGGSPDAAPQPTVLAQADNAVVAAAAPSQRYELRQPQSVHGQKQPCIGRAYQPELPHCQPSSVQDQSRVPNEVHTLLKQHDLILSTFTSGSPMPKRIPGGSSSTEQERTHDSNPRPCVC
jgi:hypothetical protein